jgi:hypothetical protein
LHVWIIFFVVVLLPTDFEQGHFSSLNGGLGLKLASASRIAPAAYLGSHISSSEEVTELLKERIPKDSGHLVDPERVSADMNSKFDLSFTLDQGKELYGSGVTSLQGHISDLIETSALIQGILDLEFPKTVGDLKQFVCSMNWVRSSIPHYNEKTSLLTDCLREIEATIGTNKKRVLDKRDLSNYSEWNEEAKNAFVVAKDLLKNSIITTHYDPAQRLCVFPDASDNHWGLFITQVPLEDLNLSFEEQRHIPLLIMSGTFKANEKKWHIKEKEAYPIMVALDKARELLKNPDGFSLFSDHKNLV